MIQIITLKDGTVFNVLNNTVIQPSGSVFVRNKFLIYAENGELVPFVTMLSNTANLEDIVFDGLSDDGTIVFRHFLHRYNILAEVGRKLVEVSTGEAGEVTREYQLFAVLEQPTVYESGGGEESEILDILLGVEE